MPRSSPQPAQPESGFAEAPAGFDHGPDAEAAPATLDAELMASDTIRRLLACDPAQRPPFVANAEVFDRRHHAWLAAKAAVCDPDKLDDQRVANLLDAALETAEMLLLGTPAALPHQTWVKLQILEEAVTDERRHGEQSAPRIMLALASLKHDLCKFEFGDGERVYPQSV